VIQWKNSKHRCEWMYAIGICANGTLPLYEADVFLFCFDVASTHHFLKEPILVHIVSHPNHVLWNFSEWISIEIVQLFPNISIVFSRENGIIPIGIHFEKFHNMYPDSWFSDPQDYIFLDINDRHGTAPSKRKWIEIDTNGFVLFISNPDSVLLNTFLYPIKVSEFFKIHFNPYDGIKTKRFLFKKKNIYICRSLIHFKLWRRIKTKWFLLFKSKKKLLGSYNSF